MEAHSWCHIQGVQVRAILAVLVESHVTKSRGASEFWIQNLNDCWTSCLAGITSEYEWSILYNVEDNTNC